MSKPETELGGDGLSAAESSLGKALAMIHCVLPHLNESDYAVRVQAGLRHAANFIESARAAHALDTGLPAGTQAHAVESETVAVIAAAVATLLGTTYKVVAVQPVVVPTPDLNVWAFEGRSQIFMSHKVR